MAGEETGRIRFLTEPQTQFAQRRVQVRPQCERGQRAGRVRVGLPDNVKHHVAVARIAVVAMAAPAGRVQINFDITVAGGLAAKLEHGAAEIRTGLVVPETGMKNAHWSAVQGPQLIAPQPLMLPDALQEPFRWRDFFRFPQRGRGQGGGSRSSIKTGHHAGHHAIAFRMRLSQSQADTRRPAARRPSPGKAAAD